jgi:thioesterase DpgC
MLEAVGLPEKEVAAWRAAVPAPTGAFEPDTAAAVDYLSLGGALLRRLPERPRRSEREQTAAEAVAAELSGERERFLGVHVERVYAALTDELATPLRDEQLVSSAAERFPGLTPTRAEVNAELDR